jgi:hypothetical protein
LVRDVRLNTSNWRVNRSALLPARYLLQVAIERPALVVLEEEFDVAVDHRQQVVEVVGDAAGQPSHGFHLLRVTQLRFELLRRRDVDVAAEHPHQAAVDHFALRARQDVAIAAVLVTQPEFGGVETDGVVDVALHHGGDALAIVGMEPRHPLAVFRGQLVIAIAKLRLVLRRKVHRLGVDVEFPQSDLRGVDGHRQPVLDRLGLQQPRDFALLGHP